jgi:CheY-like chemotaxis protein/anti-sigma regulatory factor (Ser/Thr protein kinase)
VKVTANQLCHRARVVETYVPESFVEGNAVRLEQVFVNLLINAAQAIPEGSADRNEVHISVTHEGPSIVVEVRDTGSGIPPHVLGRVFDPFFTTKPRGLGTGLGLPISRSIVTALGGEITVTSTPGLGTTFRVSLPALPVPDDRPSGRPVAADDVRAEPPFRARLLVVDDEPLVADMLRRALADSHDVTVATDAQSALHHILGGQAFDLIFCDLLMPRMSGMDLYARLETERPGVQQRIVFMTGGAFTERASQFLSEVKNPKLAKPFDLKTLEGLVLKTVTALGPA